MNNDRGPFLIVDDEPEMCWALDRILKGAGGLCHTASNAREAIDLAQRLPFRMAFLDAKLPDIDGLELARRLQESTPGIRLVLVSGYFYPDDPIIAGALQSELIVAFVAKPFVHAEILRAIHAPRLASGVPPPAIQGNASIAPTPYPPTGKPVKRL